MHPSTRQIRDTILNCIDGLSDEQMHRHPDGKWDTSAILEHLALTYGSTARVMLKVVEKGHPIATRSNWKHPLFRTVVLGFNYIPHGRTAPRQVVPSGIGAQQARALFFDTLENMDAAFAQCEHQFGNRVKIADHPVLGPISLEGWRKFHVLHTRHHAKQIDALAKLPAEPQSAAVAG